MGIIIIIDNSKSKVELKLKIKCNTYVYSICHKLMSKFFTNQELLVLSPLFFLFYQETSLGTHLSCV